MAFNPGKGVEEQEKNGFSLCQGIQNSDSPTFENAKQDGIAPAHQSSTDTTPGETTSTPASSLSVPTSETQSPPKEVKTERDEMLDNLSTYIGIGALKKRNGMHDEEEIGSVLNTDDFPEAEITSLEKHNWIRTSVVVCENDPRWCFVRVYVLPDDVGQKHVARSSKALRRALKVIMMKVDRSVDAWEGRYDADETMADEEPDAGEDESLWYIFNTLQDPKPQVETMRDLYARRSMEELLTVTANGHLETGQDFSGVEGLKTPLYPYQRRSAAAMVQREAQPAQALDPRLQVCKTPVGDEYFYDKEEGSILCEKRMYSEACGGILAETMGCGKTLICLAVILSTRGHVPQIPLQYQEMGNPVRDKTASLVEMAAAAAGRFSLPWKNHFDSLSRAGESYFRCIQACESNRGAYIIPTHTARHGGRSGVAFPRPPAQHLRLCSGTLIIVPPNLVDHWEHQIANHTEGLKVFVLRNNSAVTPSADDLLQYDIVLFSRIRFEKESGEVVNNRRASVRKEDSPLTRLHWLRIIVDEGHNVAGHQTNMTHLLSQLHVERRWIVSGTPSSGLYGVEVSLASQETSDADRSEATTAALRGRKKTGNAIDNENKDLDNLRRIVVKFLDLKPWSNSKGNDPADWTKYIKPVGKDGKRRKAPYLRATLQSLVVRHCLDVIHHETPLPQLHNKVVYLEPTYYDKLSLNLFIFILEVNAIASERKDQDYMFHPRNRKHLSLTINNLRQAGFWWNGFEQADISGTIDNATEYLDKNRDRMSEADIATLTEGIRIAQKALSCGSWNAFKQLHELGVFVQGFPSHAQGLWALAHDSHSEPLLMGVSLARRAQKFVASNLNTYDPAEGLAGAGIKARRELSEREGQNGDPGKKNMPERIVNTKSPKKTFSKGLFKTLPSESPLAATKLVGTASAKLTYLLDRVQELHSTEKIIIFYDNNNAAFWIAEGLELLGVDFRIYANTLKPALRTAYLALFRESEAVHVLLMDLRQASHGLHIANASRVFIVNPIWQPTVESQAIKRAHRIGQTRPVFVETLVLKDTLEDKILKRRKEMSDAEIQQAEKDLLDDNTMSTIIQNENFIPMPEDEASTRLARLRNPPGFFDRHKLPIPDGTDLDDAKDKSPSKPTKTTTPRKRKRVIMPDATPDEKPDIVTPHRQRSTSAGLEYRNENGILMTPPSRGSSRSPMPQRLFSPGRISPSANRGNRQGSVGAVKTEKRVSIFGGEENS
ncbi:hypothetical protein ASPWEDRAFT_22808 [Aspergillus wentii DTO 134E9]|uniref:Helicase C-terminal domain-containing protein n=1 Tax=Aspergillus wentii DTO 134E9 TaxID=1073089 RepID=A0A1L9S0E7_ASPWE|nr:uncharacterized protein ASPWEDRAFT_22808 [Aspergillus wentii DTO 134E9]OJJ40644.1 hypothetical protein ASPWEDRAFT_22808 [Aspergillus wentii DTO 134E9]